MAKKNGELFTFLNQMNQGGYEYVDKMTDEEVKGLAPFVLLMWAHGAQGPNAFIHTLMTDMYCNPYVFSLSKHPRLLLKLFVAANSDIDNCRYQFVKCGQKQQTKGIMAVAEYYDCGLTDAKQIIKLLSKEELDEVIELYEYKGTEE